MIRRRCRKRRRSKGDRVIGTLCQRANVPSCQRRSKSSPQRARRTERKNPKPFDTDWRGSTPVDGRVSSPQRHRGAERSEVRGKALDGCLGGGNKFSRTGVSALHKVGSTNHSGSSLGRISHGLWTKCH